MTGHYEVWLTSPEGEDLNCWTFDTLAEADRKYNALATAEINNPTHNGISLLDPDGKYLDR